jgi:Trypsin-like peptidase domain
VFSETRIQLCESLCVRTGAISNILLLSEKGGLSVILFQMSASGPNQEILVDALSTVSLRLELYSGGNYLLSTATGFVVQSAAEQPYLVTNWHVVTGVNPETNELLSNNTLAVPEEVRIKHHAAGSLGRWTERAEPLQDSDGNPTWIEHPLGQSIDVVALPLQARDPGIQIYPLDLSLAETEVVVRPAMTVSIIGYPYGLATATAWPIWKTGHVASDIDLDFDGRPQFIIDATARSGMSGSPVFLRSYGFFPAGGRRYLTNDSGIWTRFLGVYSGRIREQAELGRVWRPQVIAEILRT